MDLNKSLEFFDPSKVKERCHIIGCGSIGSNVAELLARYGVTDMVLWDFDVVEPHNIANQLYTELDVGTEKTKALHYLLSHINPALKSSIKLKSKYTGEALSGYVFMCVDNVEVRQMIVNANWYNPNVIAVLDFRTTLLEGQCYFADWNNITQKESLRTSLDFTHQEAISNASISACGFELSVSPVVRMCAIMGIVNFTNFVNKVPTKHLILCQPYSYFFEAM